jgi:hypothetical protein
MLSSTQNIEVSFRVLCLCITWKTVFRITKTGLERRATVRHTKLSKYVFVVEHPSLVIKLVCFIYVYVCVCVCARARACVCKIA